MKQILRVAFFTLVVSCTSPLQMVAQRTAGAGANFYVSLHGSDHDAGTASKPFASLKAAREAVRKLRAKGLPEGGVTVWVGDGLYLLEHGFTVGKEDSGEPGKPIT